MCAYENHHFHIIINLGCVTAILSGFSGHAVSILLLVQELLGEYRCKYDLGLFLL